MEYKIPKAVLVPRTKEEGVVEISRNRLVTVEGKNGESTIIAGGAVVLIEARTSGNLCGVGFYLDPTPDELLIDRSQD